MSFIDELRSFMDDESVKELGISDQEGFRITSRDQANWYIKKVQESKQELLEIEEAAAAELARVKDQIELWKEKESKTAQNAINYFNGLLREFAEQELVGSKKKSIKLPYGTLAFKSQQPKFVYDDDAVLAYLEQNAKELVTEKVTHSIDKKELKKLGTVLEGKLMLNGKVVDGIVIEEQDTKFEVK